MPKIVLKTVKSCEIAQKYPFTVTDFAQPQIKVHSFRRWHMKDIEHIYLFSENKLFSIFGMFLAWHCFKGYNRVLYTTSYFYNCFIGTLKIQQTVPNRTNWETHTLFDWIYSTKSFVVNWKYILLKSVKSLWSKEIFTHLYRLRNPIVLKPLRADSNWSLNLPRTNILF